MYCIATLVASLFVEDRKSSDFSEAVHISTGKGSACIPDQKHTVYLHTYTKINLKYTYVLIKKVNLKSIQLISHTLIKSC